MSTSMLSLRQQIEIPLVAFGQCELLPQRAPSPSWLVSSLSDDGLIKLVQTLNLESLLQSSVPQSELRERCFIETCALIKSKRWDILSKVKDEVDRLAHLGRTVLMEFAARGDSESVENLIKKRIAVFSKGPQGQTALHLVAGEGHVVLVEPLLECCDINATAEGGATPLHAAVSGNHPNMITKLLLKGANVNGLVRWVFGAGEILMMTPLALAVAFGYQECVEPLLQEPEVDLNVPLFGNIFHVAAHFGNHEMLVQLLAWDKPVGRDRIKLQSLIDAPDTLGRTPLMTACYAGAIDVIEVLYRRGASLEKTDLQSRTSMHWAVRGEQLEVARFLAWHKDRLLKVDDKDGCDPLKLAEKLVQAGSVEMRLMVTVQKNLRLEAQRGEITPPDFQRHPPENLVFQGGGPAGIAHAGVYEALKTQDKLQDLRRVAGTSAGAIVAALISSGASPEKIQELVSKDMTAFLDITPKARAFLARIKQPDLETAIAHFGETLQAIAKQAVIGGFKKKWRNIFSSLFGFGQYGIASLWFGGSRETVESFPVGLCSGAALEKEIETAIHEGTTIPNCTFAELRDKVAKDPNRYKHLWVTITCIKINEQGEDEASIVRVTSEDLGEGPKWWDSIVISSAVRASANIPFAFEPCILKSKVLGTNELIEQPHLGQFLDGGMLANLDIEVFDEQRFQTQRAFLENEELRHVMNKRTLGIALVNPRIEIASARDPSSLLSDPIQLVKAVLGVYSEAEQKMRDLKPYNKKRIVEVDRLKIKATDFSLSEEAKSALFESGRQALVGFFEKKANSLILDTGLDSSLDKGSVSSSASLPAAEHRPDAAAIFQEKIARALKATAPVFGSAFGISAQLLGVNPALGPVIATGVTVSVQESADPAAAVSVQGALKSADLAKNSFEAMAYKKP